MLGKTEAVTDIMENPYQPYQGQQIAAFSPTQVQAMQNISNQQIAPQLQEASNFASQVGQMALQTPEQARGLQNAALGYGAQAAGTGANYAQMGLNLALKQSPKIQNVDFICDSYENLDFENCLVYADPPYQGTTGYKTGAFDHDKFFNWCREQAKKNVVFVSEYKAPDDFDCVWQGEIKTNFASNRKSATHKAVEKLFKVP